MVYKRQATGERETFRERNKTRMRCATCSVTVEASYIKAHIGSIDGICIPKTRGVDEVGGGLTTYVVSFPKFPEEVRYPVPGCPTVAHSAGGLREHFMFRHFISKLEVGQEGKMPLTLCDL